MSFTIDLVDLRLFIYVAETRSVTRGADRACISPGAASTRIKNMEETLGFKVLNRTTHGMVMTPAGETLLAHARQVQRQMERMRRDMQEHRQGMRGRVVIHAISSSMSGCLPEAVADFLSRHTGVAIELKESLGDDAVRALAEGQADIGVVGGEVDTAGLVTRPFGSNNLVLAVHASSPLARREKVSFAEALRQPLVGLHESSALHRFLERRAEQAGSHFHLRAHVGSFEAICRMASTGIAVGVVPQGSARRHACSMDIVGVPLADPWAQRELSLITRDESSMPPLILEVFMHLAAFPHVAPPTLTLVPRSDVPGALAAA